MSALRVWIFDSALDIGAITRRRGGTRVGRARRSEWVMRSSERDRRLSFYPIAFQKSKDSGGTNVERISRDRACATPAERPNAR